MNKDKAFEILEIEYEASYEETKSAYKVLVRIWHPDKYINDKVLYDKACSKMSQINLAWDYLEKNHFNKNIEKNDATSPSDTYIIPCPYCATNNRVPAGRYLDAKCGICKKHLHPSKYKKENSSILKDTNNKSNYSYSTDDCNSHNNNDCKESDKKLGLKWYYFYITVFLPLNILFAIYYEDIYKQELFELGYNVNYLNSFNLFPDSLKFIFYVFAFLALLTMLGLYIKNKFAWKANWLLVAITTMAPQATPMKNINYNVYINIDWNVYLYLFIFKFLIYFLPSYFYWMKRKHLFD